MDETFDSPATSDFPTDPIVNHDLVFWLILTACLIIFASVLTALFKEAERRMHASAGDAIDRRAKAVKDVMVPSAKSGIDNQIADAGKIQQAVNKQFGKTLTLSRKLAKITGDLNKAVEGLEEKPYTGGGANAPAQMSGGTYINISLGADGKPMAAAPAPVAAAQSTEPALKTPEEKRRDVWMAIQKVFDYWKNLAVVTAAYRAAQQQLIDSPRWDPPRPEDAPKSRLP